MIEQDPFYGYRTVAGLLNMNKNTVQRIFQIQGWQVKKRPIGFRPRVEALPSMAVSPDERWATDLCRIWEGRDGWVALALVIDCYTREFSGWHLSRSGKARTAEAALEQALIARSGTLVRVRQPFLLRSDKMAWSLPAEASQPWSEATVCNKSASRPTARNKMGWSSV